MPLVLSQKIGDDFYAGDSRFAVTDIYQDTSFTLVKDGVDKYEITEYEAVEVMPEVFISSGDFFQSGVVRVVIDAPRSIVILRGDKYREQQEADELA